MATDHELFRFAHATPFRPFRVRMKDGRLYDIGGPHSVIVGDHRANLGIKPDGDGMPTGNVFVLLSDIESITHIVPVKGTIVFTQADLQQLCRTRPFAAFRIHLTSGNLIDILSPEQLVAQKRLALVGIDDERWAMVYYLHIAHIENLPPRQTQGNESASGEVVA